MKNPWQYQFRRRPRQPDEHTLQSASGLNSASHVQRAGQHARDYHISSSSSSSTDPVHGSEESRSDTDVDDSDWFITGGSSGGSAVAVATGVAFA